MFLGIFFNEKLMRKYLILNFLRTYGIQKLQILIDDTHYFELLITIISETCFFEKQTILKVIVKFIEVNNRCIDKITDSTFFFTY